MPFETIPLPPIFPGARPLEGLHLGTQQRLAGASLRKRASPTMAQAMTLTRLEPKTHGLDVLLYWWAATQACGEHLDILGSVAKTPMAFLQSYAGCEVMVMHGQDTAWQEWEGVVAVFWSSEVIPLARYRLDFWIAPEYRHPVLTTQIAQGVLHHLFEIRQFQLVYGITPITNRLALRFFLRLGFRHRVRLPGGTIAPQTGQPLDAMMTLIPRADWRAQQAERARNATH